MTNRGKRELVAAIRPRYLQASKTEKNHILNEFVAVTGYHRKHAIRLLKNGYLPKRSARRGRPKTYTGEVVTALVQIWEICDRICSKRLQPFLPEMVAVLERHGELVLPKETKNLLLQMSRSTIDRCLQPVRYAQPRRLGTTKPGTLLKQAIPIRTFADWDDLQPGFVEIDLVAHCGESVHGQFLNTLNVVDVATGWSECLALRHRSQKEVSAAIERLRTRLPFPLLGLDSDNDSAFINDTLYRYCLQEKLTFTRSRPYKKNDQAHVEQKNWSVVRRLIGYDRYETAAELACLRTIYQDWRLYVNFFQPVLKLVDKQRLGSKVRKRYDQAQTPYQRVLAAPAVSPVTKAYLRQLYLTLNPVTLRQRIDANLAKLWKLPW